MTQFHPMDNLINGLLNNQAFAGDLSDDDKAAVKAILGEFMDDFTGGELDPLFHQPQSSAQKSDDAAHLNNRLSELDVVPSAMTGNVNLNQLLDQQSDETLLKALKQYVETASLIIEVLSLRRRRGEALTIVRGLELQSMALSIGVDDLTQALERGDDQNRRPLKQQIKALLLHEFRFINRWVRRI